MVSEIFISHEVTKKGLGTEDWGLGIWRQETGATKRLFSLLLFYKPSLFFRRDELIIS
jgi:hypothetical protein